MKKALLFTTLFALCLGSVALVQDKSRVAQVSDVSVSQATSGSFRDGLYLGKLAAARGEETHIASGRWATQADRVAFTAGFQQGYQQESAHVVSRLKSE